MEAGASQPAQRVTGPSRGAATPAARPRRAQPSGWWGMALFLCAEVTLFGTVIATYFYLDFDAPKWPPAGIKPPSVVLPLVGTGVLVATTVPLLLAVRASRAGRRTEVCWLTVLAVAVQLGYLALQALLFRHDLRQFRPQDTAYGSVYFTMLALHHAHVILGILLELGVIWKIITRGLTDYWLIGLRSVALYWYVINVLAVLVVLTQLSPSL